MNISEYAKSRSTSQHQLNRATISMYITRNPSLFNGHTKKATNGKETLLDEQAIDILDKKYYIPEPIAVYPDIDPECERKLKETIQELDSLKEKYTALQAAYDLLVSNNHHYELQLTEMNGQKALLEQKVESLNEAKEALKAKDSIITTKENDINMLRNMLDTEKNNHTETKIEKATAEEALKYTTERAEAAEAEANSYIKSWFGFYRKQK